MKVLYTQLGVEEALTRLASVTAPAPTWRQWLLGKLPADSDRSAWSRVTSSTFEMGIPGRGMNPPFLLGSVANDTEAKNTRVQYRVWGPAVFALMAFPIAAIFELMGYLIGGPLGPGSLLEAVARFAVVGSTIFAIGYLVLHLLLRNDTRRLTEFLKEALEAAEQPPARPSESLKG